MNTNYSEQDIPKGIQEALSKIYSEKVRQSFLNLLENAWNRNNNNHHNL